MPNAETYTALEKGVVDGAAWTSIGILTAKFYEVNKYLLRPTFGAGHLLVLMNLNRWKGLSAEDRKVVEDAGRTVEKSWATDVPRMVREEEATLVKDHGMKVSRTERGLIRQTRVGRRRRRLDARRQPGRTRRGRAAQARTGKGSCQIGCCPRGNGIRTHDLAMARVTSLHDAITRGGYQLAALIVILIAGSYCYEVAARYFFNCADRHGRMPLVVLSALRRHLPGNAGADAPPRPHRDHDTGRPLPTDPARRHLWRSLLAAVAAATCFAVFWISASETWAQFRDGVLTVATYEIPKWWISIFIAYGLLSSALVLPARGARPR